MLSCVTRHPIICHKHGTSLITWTADFWWERRWRTVEREVSGGGEQQRGFAKQNPRQPKENAFGTAFSWF